MKATVAQTIDPFPGLHRAPYNWPNGTLKAPLNSSATTCFPSFRVLEDFKDAELEQKADPESRRLTKKFGYEAAEYGRYGGTTVNCAQRLLASLWQRADGSPRVGSIEEAMLFPTQQNAVISFFSATLQKAKGPHHIILADNTPRSILEYCRTHLRNVEVTVLNQEQLSNVARHFQDNTRFVFLAGSQSLPAEGDAYSQVLAACRKSQITSVIAGQAALPRGEGSYEYHADVLIPCLKHISGDPYQNLGLIVSDLKTCANLSDERGIFGGIPAAKDAHRLIGQVETYPLRLANDRLISSGQWAQPQQNTISQCELQLAKNDGAEAAVLLSSGMSATLATFSALLFRGGEQGPKHIIVMAEGYRKNRAAYEAHFKNSGVEVTYVSAADFHKVAAHIRENTAFIFAELPTNPHFLVPDINTGIAACKAGHPEIPVIVDHTFVTYLGVKPLELGADLVVYSATKYHLENTGLAGVVAGKAELVDLVRREQKLLGLTASAVNAEEMIGRSSCFELRLAHKNSAARLLVEALKNDPRIGTIWSPYHPAHPSHEVASRVLTPNFFGSVISFEPNFLPEQIAAFVDAMLKRSCKLGPSFGGPESMISHVATVSHRGQSAEEKARLNITDTLMRLDPGLLPGDTQVRFLLEALEEACPLEDYMKAQQRPEETSVVMDEREEGAEEAAA